MRNSFLAIYLVILIALLFGALTGLSAVSAQSQVDYDADDDGLIEIEWLEQLDAVRWDLDGDGVVDDGGATEPYSVAFPDAVEGMGCQDGCQGYELARNLDFNSAGSYASGVVKEKWTSEDGWLPIGLVNSFQAVFDGNEHTVTGLHIRRVGSNQSVPIGLFGSSNGDISHIGLIGVSLKCGDNSELGSLVGNNTGKISASYAIGYVTGGHPLVGGLVGNNGGDIRSSYAWADVVGGTVAGGLVGDNSGSIVSSHAAGRVSGLIWAGGLAGRNRSIVRSSYSLSNVSSGGSAGGLVGQNSGSVAFSYATGTVSGDTSGGLVGFNFGSIVSSYADSKVSGNWSGGLAGYSYGKISYSYSVGRVSSGEHAGAFLGTNGEEGEILSSYWNIETSVQSTGVGEGSAAGAESMTTSELQEPTDYAGIYGEWLTDSDNADEDYDVRTGVDDVWDFGTSSQYPELKADLDGDGQASWWEFGRQHERSTPTHTPIPIATNTPAPTASATQAPMPTNTPTPTQTATPTNTRIPTGTPTVTPAPKAHHTPVPALTPEPTGTLVPPRQTPAVVAVVVTATPSADVPSASGCNSVGAVPAGTAANLMFMLAPLAIIGGVRYRRRKMGSDCYE